MFVPQLIPAASALPEAPAGAVALAGQDDFHLAYDAAATVPAINPPPVPDTAIIIPDLAAAVDLDPDMPILAGDMMGEINPDQALMTMAEPAITAAGPDPKTALSTIAVADPRQPVKITQHALVQMMFDSPAAPVPPPAADAPVLPAPTNALLAPRPPALAEEIARANLPDPALVPTPRDALTIKQDAAIARMASAVAAPPTQAPLPAAVPLPVAAASPPAAPAPALVPLPDDIPAAAPPAIAVDRAVPPPVAAMVKRPELVTPAVKGLDPTGGTALGGDESAVLFAPAGDTTTTAGAARAWDTSTAPALARHVAQQLAVTITQTGGQLTEIALNPDELGRVRMSMSLTDGTLMLHINAERPETADLLRRHIDTLAQEFRSLGYDDISFDFGDGRRQDDARHDAGPLPDHAEDVTEQQVPDLTEMPQPRSGLDLRL
jgi:hypothetical protein